MPDAMTFTFTEDDLSGGASYDDFEPGEYVGTLVAIKDVQAKTGNTGLRWEFQVQGLTFSTTTWLKGGGGWKLAEVLRGLGKGIEPGQAVRVNPPELIGKNAMLKIGYDASSNRPDFLTVLRVIPEAIETSQTSLFTFDDEDEELGA